MSMSPPFDIKVSEELLPPSFFERSLKIKIPLPKTVDITLYFNDTLEVLKILDEGGDILKYLLRENPICPLMGSRIEFGKVLGKGRNGIVFDVVLKGQSSPSKYVAKRAKQLTIDMPLLTANDLMDVWNVLTRKNIPKEEAFAFNGMDYLNPVPKGVFVVPLFLEACLPPDEVPPKVYACADMYSEYLLSLIVAHSFKRSGRSANFIDTFLFSTCDTAKDLRQSKTQYTFMEKIDTTLYDTLKRIRIPYKAAATWGPSLAESLFIQTLHAIATYQTLKITHGDLHDSNVFIEKVKPDTEFNGRNLMKADYYEYRIGDVRLYLPGGASGREGQYLIKIGDWGYGCKFSKPVVCSRKVYLHKYKYPYDRPRGFETAYDMLFISTIFANKNWRSDFITRALLAMFDGNPGAGRKTLRSLINKYIDNEDFGGDSEESSYSASGRPKLALIETLRNADPLKILTDHRLVGKYMKKPPVGSRIVVLGTL